jgi:hypothetical protein
MTSTQLNSPSTPSTKIACPISNIPNELLASIWDYLITEPNSEYYNKFIGFKQPDLYNFRLVCTSFRNIAERIFLKACFAVRHVTCSQEGFGRLRAIGERPKLAPAVRELVMTTTTLDSSHWFSRRNTVEERRIKSKAVMAWCEEIETDELFAKLDGVKVGNTLRLAKCIAVTERYEDRGISDFVTVVRRWAGTKVVARLQNVHALTVDNSKTNAMERMFFSPRFRVILSSLILAQGSNRSFSAIMQTTSSKLLCSGVSNTV